jgi:cerevisin
MAKFFEIVALLSMVFLAVASPARPADKVVHSSSEPSSESSGDTYNVIFNHSHPNFPHVSDVLSHVGLHADHDDVHTIFNSSIFRGFCASMTSGCIDTLRAMPGIAVVEPAKHVRTAFVTARTGSPWGLQRISQAKTVTGDILGLSYNYTYDTSTQLGAGVDIYSVDTGIYTGHLAFAGRAKMIWPTTTSFDDNGALQLFITIAGFQDR